MKDKGALYSINFATVVFVVLVLATVGVLYANRKYVDTPLNASYDPKKKLYVMSTRRGPGDAASLPEKLEAYVFDVGVVHVGRDEDPVVGVGRDVTFCVLHHAVQGFVYARHELGFDDLEQLGRWW